MLWLTAAVLLIIMLASLKILGIHIARRFSFPETKSMEQTYRMSTDARDFTDAYFRSLNLVPFTLTSPFGYSLRGVTLAPEGREPAGVIVLVHGHRYSWHGMVKFFPIFQDMGWAVVTYNHRFHGDSGGVSCSAGYFEKHDLDAVIRWTRRQFPRVPALGIMGESMGAASVMQYLGMDDCPVDFAVADCPYSSMEEIYRVQLSRNHLPQLLHGPIISQARRYLLKSSGFDLREVSPKRAVMESPTPLLLIHGEADDFVPPWMSRTVYEARRDHAPTRLLLVPGAAHAQCLAADPETYTREVREFIASALQRQSDTAEGR